MIGYYELKRRIKVFFINKKCVCCDNPLDKKPPRKLPKWLMLCCSCKANVECMVMRKEVYYEYRNGIYGKYMQVQKQIRLADKLMKINQRLREFQNSRGECST